MAQKNRRPAHETIVDLVTHCETQEELELVAWFLTMTKIPKRIDAVIAAWEERCADVEDQHGLLHDALADLHEQKQELERAEKLARLKEEFVLDEIMR